MHVTTFFLGDTTIDLAAGNPGLIYNHPNLAYSKGEQASLPVYYGEDYMKRVEAIPVLPPP